MTAPTVLLIGFDPYKLPGRDPEPVAEGLARGRERFAELGLDADECLIGLDDGIEAEIVAALTARRHDCVVVGGGIRKPPELLELFEDVVNLVRRHDPGAEIAFNAAPDEAASAAARRLGLTGPGSVSPG